MRGDAASDTGGGEGCINDLTSYWSLDNAENIVQDRAGENLGWINGASTSQGKAGTCLGFDGDDYVNISDSNSIRLTKKFTLMAWVKSSVNS